MICPDINLLLYAVHEDFPQHAKAKAWWDGVLSGSEPVSLLHAVVLGFVRLSTSPKVFQQPLIMEAAFSVVDGWLAQPVVRWQTPGAQHWELVKKNLGAIRTAGNLTTNAHIAAVAAEFGLIVHSNDADFGRFPGVKQVNPLRPR